MTETVVRRNKIARNADRVGLAAMIIASVCLVALGAHWVSGPMVSVVVLVLALVLGSVIALAFTGGPEARRLLAPYGLLKPGMLWLALFFLAPVWSLLRISLSTKQSRFSVHYNFSWAFQNYSTAFRDFGKQFEHAFVYAAIATVLTILIGYPLAYVIAFRGGKYKNILLGLVVIPFFTSYLIRTIAWSTILADRGVVVHVLHAVGLEHVFEWMHIMENGKLLNTPAAVIGGLTYNFLPFMLLPIYVSLEKIDTNLVNAAGDLYSNASRAFRKIVFPLSIPGVFAGTLLTFIPAAGDFVNAQFLGNPNTTMIGNSIQDQFLKQNNYPVASAMAAVLMVSIATLVLLYTRIFGTEDLA
ncbi:MAG: ABC transporter permease [Actinomycetota bacterium]|jgi:spermidine/putrescine transport system permease protein